MSPCKAGLNNACTAVCMAGMCTLHATDVYEHVQQAECKPGRRREAQAAVVLHVSQTRHACMAASCHDDLQVERGDV